MSLGFCSYIQTVSSIDTFEKNNQTKNIFWILLVVMARVLARVVDPVTAQQVVGVIMGMGV